MSKLVIYEDGSRFWYLNGLLHREDGPACEHADGNKCWYINGKLHRVSGPAVDCANGSKEWYLNGVRHRRAGPPIINDEYDYYDYINSDGFKEHEEENYGEDK